MKSELEQVQHARSVKQYPNISLNDGEYVVINFKRSKMGIFAIWATVVAIIVLLSICIIAISRLDFFNNSFFNFGASALGYLRVGIVCVYVLIFLAGLVSHATYDGNEMYITNRRAIQKIRNSLFSNSTNIIELTKIEDVSFRQENMLQHILKMGTLRLSTVGDETTYTFPFLDTPKDETETIARLVMECKKGKKS